MCGGWHSGSCGIDASSGFGAMMIAVVANVSGGSRTYAVMVVAYAYLCVRACGGGVRRFHKKCAAHT